MRLQFYCDLPKSIIFFLIRLLWLILNILYILIKLSYKKVKNYRDTPQPRMCRPRRGGGVQALSIQSIANVTFGSFHG